MKKLDPLILVGMIGMIVTPIVHLVFALINSHPSIHKTFGALYLIFIAFITMGGGKLRLQRIPVRRK